MECYELELSPSFEKVTVNIQYKNIKNVHLKVFRNLNVVLSVPLEITDDWVISFLLGKSSWIEKQLQKYKGSSGHKEYRRQRQMCIRDRFLFMLMKKKSYTNKHLKNGGVRLLIKFTVKKWMKFTPEFSKSMV